MMNLLDISKYLTPAYLEELISSHQYHANLFEYAENYDWDSAMALETLYIEMAMGHVGLLIIEDYSDWYDIPYSH